MTKLTQAQQELLRAAAEADDGAIDAPEDRKSFATLIKRGLIISVPQDKGASRLLITDAGRAAINELVVASSTADQPGQAAAPEPAPIPTPKGKIGVLIALLRRPEGATVEAMMAATEWQAHSVRGALSGSVKKGLGLTVGSEKTDGVRVYRITGEVEA
jgi:hypothetical protein